MDTNKNNIQKRISPRETIYQRQNSETTQGKQCTITVRRSKANNTPKLKIRLYSNPREI